MTNVPPEEQREIIKKIEINPTVVGDKLCPICHEWYDKWKFYVGYDNNEPTSAEIKPIDNSKVISQGRLSSSAIEGVSYDLIRKESYDYLEKWYTGGPQLVLELVPDNRGKPVIIKTYIQIIINFKNEEKPLEIHKFMKISQIHKMARELFNVPEDLTTRLVNYFNHNVSKVYEEDKYAEDYVLINKEDVLLDYLEDDNWNSSKLKQLSRIDSHPSTSGASTQGGVVGFHNLGNTCFFNSGTQCLMHSVPLIAYMLEDKWKDDLNDTNPIGMKGELAKAFASLAKDVWSGHYSTISPRDLKHVVGRYAPQFSGWGQQDSHELILFMLDGIHEDLNRCKKKPTVEFVEGDGTDDEEKAIESWKRYKLRNDSIVVDFFHGQLRSRLICPKCHSTTVVFDPYASIPMPIIRPHTKKIKITYVPFDFFEERKTFKVEISSDKSPNESVSESISTFIGKPVKVQLGVRSYAESPIKWGLKESSYSTSVIFAYEIPDENALYIPCSIKVKGEGYYSSQTTGKVATPFLVDINDLPDDFDESDEGKELFTKKIEERISKLWDPTANFETNEKIEELKKDIDFEHKTSKDFKDSSQKIDFAIKTNQVSYYYSKKENVKTHFKNNDLFVNSQATVYLNPDSKYSVEGLLCNAVDLLDKDEKKKSDSITLDQCFNYLSLPEVLDEKNQWYCPKCKEFVCAEKKLDIWKVPKIMIIQLKRFFGSSHFSSKKLDYYVDFPEIIDMKKYVIGPQKNEETLNYRLYAVSNHMGGLGGGHYTAYSKVRNPLTLEDKGWYSFNDSSASKSSESSAHTSAAYVLFYERI